MSLNTSKNFSTPAHIYSISCQSGGRIGGYVFWAGSSNLNAYIYRQGTDFYGTALQSYSTNDTLF